MNSRFSIDKINGIISFERFETTALQLEASLRGVRPTVKSEILATTSREDYYGAGSLTIETPESLEAWGRREKHPLADLNEALWNRSFETGLYIRDDSLCLGDYTGKSYMVTLTREVREPHKLFFYAQSLDPESQRIFDAFRYAGLSEKVGNGFPKSSDFAVAHAFRSVLKPKTKFSGVLP